MKDNNRQSISLSFRHRPVLLPSKHRIVSLRGVRQLLNDAAISGSDSLEMRSGHQPPLALTALPLLKKEGTKYSPLLRGVDSNPKDEKTECVKIQTITVIARSVATRPARLMSGGQSHTIRLSKVIRYVAVGACPDAYWSSTTLSGMTIDFSEESIFKNNSTPPSLTAFPLLKKEGRGSEVRSGQALTRTLITVLTVNKILR